MAWIDWDDLTFLSTRTDADTYSAADMNSVNANVRQVRDNLLIALGSYDQPVRSLATIDDDLTTVEGLVDALGGDGWLSAGETWTYASANSPTFTLTVAGDKTTKYSVGMKVKLTQTTVKYFIITAISYSSPNTTITLNGGMDYTLANATISNNYFSMMKSPYGFPIAMENQFSTQGIVTSSRTLGTVYRNTSHKPMMVTVSVNIYGGQTSYAYTDSNTSPSTVVAGVYNLNASYVIGTMTFIVLPGNYYKVATGPYALTYWTEWY